MERDAIPMTEVPSEGASDRRTRDALADGTPGYRDPKVAEVEEGGSEEGGRSRRRLWPWLVGAALLLAAVLSALWWFGIWPFASGDGDAAEEAASGGRQSGPVPVSTAVAALEEIPVYYEYDGLTFASRRAEIRPRISGAIEERLFEEGSEVEEGQVLYRIDARPFEAALAQAEASLESAEASLAFAEAQVERFAELQGEGFATGETYDQALARREELQGQVAAAEAAIRSAELNRQYAEVRAPFSGRIGLSQLYEGELASPGGEALTTLVQLQPIEVRFEIGEGELSRIRRAMTGPDPLRVVALLEDDAAYAEYGALTALDNAVDTGTGTITAVARFPNPGGLLPPGRLVTARLLLGRADAIVIPADALSAQLDRRIVYRVGPEGKAVGTPVETGRRIGEGVVVTAGLRPGDRIVTSNLQSVRDGVALELPSPEPPSAPPAPASAGDGDRADRDALAVGEGRPPPLAPTVDTEPRPPQGPGLSEAPAGGPASDLGPAGSTPLVGAEPAGADSPAGGLDARGSGPTLLGPRVGTAAGAPEFTPPEPPPPEPLPTPQ